MTTMRKILPFALATALLACDPDGDRGFVSRPQQWTGDASVISGSHEYSAQVTLEWTPHVGTGVMVRVTGGPPGQSPQVFAFDISNADDPKEPPVIPLATVNPPGGAPFGLILTKKPKHSWARAAARETIDLIVGSP